MKKQSKQLLILLVVLVAMLAVFFGLKKYNKQQSEKEAESTAETIVDVNPENIVRLTYDYEEETNTFEKVDDQWYYAEDHSLVVTQYMIQDMLSAIAPLQAEQIIKNVTDMEQYGLADPERTIQYETEDASHIIEVGDYNAVSEVYYIRLSSDNTVYVVPSDTVTVFDTALADVASEEQNSDES